MALNRHKKTYSCYTSMLQRCYNPNSKRYYTHGARGIKVCDRWRENYDNFVEDMGQKPDGYSIERIDNNGNYQPDNCRWATPKEQAANRRTNVLIPYNGKPCILQEVSNAIGIRQSSLSKRLRTMPLEKALSKERFDRPTIEIKIKEEILQRHFLGESGGKLAKEYKISQQIISKWKIKLAKNVDFVV